MGSQSTSALIPFSDGRPVVRKQTEAIYRIFDELKKRHPGLEIESCASGGGRIDLGMIDHADRFWTSDQNDPTRSASKFNGGLALVIPPEYLGTHIGPTSGPSDASNTFNLVPRSQRLIRSCWH
jgi:alpha-galactosidase